MRSTVIALLATLCLSGCIDPLLEIVGTGAMAKSYDRNVTRSDDAIRQATAGQIHVPMQDVTVADVQRNASTTTWIATAKGAAWSCSSSLSMLATTCSRVGK